MSTESKHDATAPPNLAEILDGVRELGGDIFITFSASGILALFEVTLPNLKLRYNIQGDSEQDCILKFAKKFKPTYQYFAEQNAEYAGQQLREAMFGIMRNNSSTAKSATTEDELHHKTPE